MKKLVFAMVLSVLFSGSFAQNNCLEFDGVNDYVASASNPNLNMYASSFTVECWIWGDNSLSYSSERIIIEYGEGWQTGTYQIASISDNHLRVTFDGRSSVNGAQISDLDWTDGKWHHIAGVFNNADDHIKLYFDGVEVASAVEQYFPNSAVAPLYIGSRKGTENFSQIKMDEIRIWNVARTPTEIRQNMYRELTNPASETNLKAYYKLNETSGTTATESKNSYNGTLGNYGSQTGYWQASPAMFGPKNALDFDGINEHVFISSLSSTFTQGTISFWIRLTAIPSTNSRIFSDTWDDDEIILTTGEGKISTLNMISGDELVSSNALPISEWTHVAITMDNSVSKLYINPHCAENPNRSEKSVNNPISYQQNTELNFI